MNGNAELICGDAHSPVSGDKFAIRITARPRHADLWELSQRIGGNRKLAAELQICAIQTGRYVNLQSYPKARRGNKERFARIVEKLNLMTGKSFDELWPESLRNAIDVGRIVQEIDVRREVDIQLLHSDANARFMLPSPEASAALSEATAVLDSIVKTLPFRYRDILCRRFGLCGHTETSAADIASEFRITRTRVMQIISMSINALRRVCERRKILPEDFGDIFSEQRDCVVIEGHATQMYLLDRNEFNNFGDGI